ncbi:MULTISPECIES: hypothetical protein [unclassified Streptomyces]|uniref:hypothetical protein n=1 Tax=unclassified Streptomyces TaxID=2593676 RepID=UPI00386C9CC0
MVPGEGDRAGDVRPKKRRVASGMEPTRVWSSVQSLVGPPFRAACRRASTPPGLASSGRERGKVPLGERTIHVETGQAAQFSTLIPHAVKAHGGPAEILIILDRDGQRTHLRSSA